MTHTPIRRWTRWVLAAGEGASFGWFLFISHIAASNVIQISEWVGSGRLEEAQPRLTLWVQYLFPEDAWSLLCGVPAFSIGFGLISLTSNEALPGRLFRWIAMALFTALLALSLPAMAAFKNLSGGPDGHQSDEVLFVALALSVLLYGIIRCRRFQHPQA